MIYLIGGPPKCGKTTLAKRLSKKLGIPWISSDTLEVIGMEYVWKLAPKKFDGLYPHATMKGNTNDETYSFASPQQIAKNYIKEAKATYAAIDMLSICEITEENDYIVEGYHVTPELATRLMKKYGQKNFRALFLVKTDIDKFVQDVQKSTTHNDWVLRNTKKKETLYKIGSTVKECSHFFEKGAKIYGFRVMNMDKDFKGQVKKSMEFLMR